MPLHFLPISPVSLCLTKSNSQSLHFLFFSAKFSMSSLVDGFLPHYLVCYHHILCGPRSEAHPGFRVFPHTLFLECLLVWLPCVLPVSPPQQPPGGHWASLLTAVPKSLPYCIITSLRFYSSRWLSLFAVLNSVKPESMPTLWYTQIASITGHCNKDYWVNQSIP